MNNIDQTVLQNLYQILPQAVIEVAERRGDEIYAVGGCIRNLLIGLDVPDIDFSVVGDAVGYAKELARQEKSGEVATYARFGTALVRLGDHQLEFATSRKESYSPESRNPTEVIPVPIDEDLKRRDFTMNAMAYGLTGHRKGELIDLFNGQQDIADQIVRTPLEPEMTFSDDPLRMLRAIRFAADLGFEIEPITWEGIITSASRLQIVVMDRIRGEFWRMMEGRNPVRAVRMLLSCGLMDYIIPELKDLGGIEQVGKHHHKDVLTHTLKVMQNVVSSSEDPTLRIAALLHDIGKPRSKRFIPESGWTFHGHEVTGARLANRIARRLTLGKGVTQRLTKLIGLHMRPINLADEGVTDHAIRRLMVESGEDIDDLLTLCRADITTANTSLLKRYLTNFDEIERRIGNVEARDKMRNFHSPIRGEEIMELLELKPGPMVGVFKERIEDAILDGEIPYDYDAAKEFLFRIKDDVLSTDISKLRSERKERSRKRRNINGDFQFPQ